MIIFHPPTHYRRIPNRKVLSSRNTDFYCSDVSAIAFFKHTISYFFYLYFILFLGYITKYACMIIISSQCIPALVANVRKMSTQKLRLISTLFILFYLFLRAESFLHGYWIFTVNIYII